MVQLVCAATVRVDAVRCTGSVVMSQGSRDNMSVVVVAFEGAPKVSDEAKEKEAELDSRLELKVKGARLKIPY